MRYKKLILIGLLLSMLQPISSVMAANGDLEINDQVIQRKETKAQQVVNTAYEVMPDIFLSERNTTVLQQKKAKQQQIKKVKQAVFKQPSKMTNRSYQRIIGQKISFKKVADDDQQAIQEKRTTRKMPSWLKWSLIIAILGLASWLGIYLGKKYAAAFRKGK